MNDHVEHTTSPGVYCSLCKKESIFYCVTLVLFCGLSVTEAYVTLIQEFDIL